MLIKRQSMIYARRLLATASVVCSIGLCRSQVTLPAKGIINTIAGTGTVGFAGDGGPATSAEFHYALRIAVDASGNIYIADCGNNRVRKIAAATGVITTIAGNGTAGYSGDGKAAVSAEVSSPYGIAVDSSDNVYIADYGNNRIRKIASATGVISTVAGTGTAGWTGDGGAATSAELNEPTGLATDVFGNIYVSDYGNHRIRLVNVASGKISTIAGNGTAGYSGDGGLAVNAEISAVFAVTIDTSGNIYIPDHGNSRIRKVAAGTGVISTIAGNGTAGYSGDNGLASSAEINSPSGLSTDAAGDIYFADTNNGRIRKITAASQIITTVAGTGASGFSGDKGLATNAALNFPQDVQIDGTGNLYVMDYSNARVRAVGPVKLPAPVTLAVSVSSSGYNTSPPVATASVPSGTGLVTFSSTAGWNSGPIPVSTGVATTPVNTAGWKVGTYTITATYSGNNAYNSGTGSAGLKITQVSSAVAWKTPAPISYNTPLSNAQLNASSAVPGTYSYSSVAGTILHAGSTTLTVTFTPTDTTDYAVSTASVVLVVNKAVPVITWHTPAALMYGATLSATQLDATASTSGTFVYTPALNSKPALGNNVLTTVFTPTDAADYTTASASVTLLVVSTPTFAISPLLGVPGTAVTITNTNFGATQGTSTVTFGGTAVPISNWTSASIIFTVPQTTVAGVYTIAVNVGGSAVGQQSFTVIPKITGISFALTTPPLYPSLSGPPQVGFVISGYGFGANNTPANTFVTLDGTQLPITSWSNTQVVVQVPAAFPKGGPAGPVVLTYTGLASLDAINFTVVCPFMCPQGLNCQ